MAFRYPEYLTTPQLREIYSEDFARGLLIAGMLVAALTAFVSIALGKRFRLAASAMFFLVLAMLLGGPSIEVGAVGKVDIYFGLVFFILNLLAFAALFIAIEKFFGHRKKQLIFRDEWQTDLIYFAFNHILIGIFLIIINTFISQFHFVINQGLQEYVQSLNIVIQFLLVMLVADIVQYWSHRAYHEVPFLWKFHAVHHSSKEMDWIAGSRVHIVEILITRTFVFLPIVLLGFSNGAVNAYLIFVAFQAVFDHANISVNPGLLRYIIVTPNFHHWHHSQDQEALDKNYAVHFAFLDYLFKTAVNSQKMWPDRYGVLGDYVPRGFIKQFIFPFKANLLALEKKEKQLISNLEN